MFLLIDWSQNFCWRFSSNNFLADLCLIIFNESPQWMKGFRAPFKSRHNAPSQAAVVQGWARMKIIVNILVHLSKIWLSKTKRYSRKFCLHACSLLSWFLRLTSLWDILCKVESLILVSRTTLCRLRLDHSSLDYNHLVIRNVVLVMQSHIWF